MSHVVLVSRIYAPEPAAASFRLQALVAGLCAAGHDVTVLTTTPRPGSADAGRSVDSADSVPGARPEGSAPRRGRLRVRRARVLRNAEGYVRGYVQYMSFDIPVALRLARVARPDVIVVEPPPTTGVVVRVIAALRRVPYVYYAADLWSDAVVSDSGRGAVARVLARVEGWAMRGARGVIAVSPVVAERVRALTGTRGDVEVVTHGINTDIFSPAPGTHEGSSAPGADAPSGAPSAAYFVYTGTTSSWHGADIFIRALPIAREQVPGLELVYLGHGSQWSEIQELAAREAPGAVHFHPIVPPEQAAAWLRASRGAIVSLKPGQNYDLAFPTKLYAATGCGVPVVFAGVGPALDAVAGGDLGLAVDYDVLAVAQAMIDLATAETGRWDGDRLAGWAREHVSIAMKGAQAAALVAGWAGPSKATNGKRP